MSDTQDDRDLLHEVMIVVEDGERDTEIAAMQIIELCRAHFQRHAEPVAESTKTNLIDESGGYWIDGEFRIEGKDLDAMLDRLYTSPPIPPDMVMVPREPTEERLKRGVRAFQSGFNGTDNLSDWLAFWQAMITDAPANKEG